MAWASQGPKWAWAFTKTLSVRSSAPKVSSLSLEILRPHNANPLGCEVRLPAK